MLIVAIPKSASTSLMKSLGNLHNLAAVQDFSFKNKSIPQESKYLHKVHSDIREIDNEDVNRFSQIDKIYKQHIFPSANNVELLKNQKKVILLRNPDDIILAYRRGNLKGVHTLLPGFSGKLNEEEWASESEKSGLLSDINYFYTQWIREGETEKTLIVKYEDLIDSPEKVVRKIEAFWGLALTEGEINLAREKFSRRSGMSHIAFIFKKNVRVFLIWGLKSLGLEKFVRRMIKN